MAGLKSKLKSLRDLSTSCLHLSKSRKKEKESPHEDEKNNNMGSKITNERVISIEGLRPLADGPYIDIVTITHAERMDTVFPQWLRLAYRGGGETYTPYDLNMPTAIPRRPLAHYKWDPPLTEHGVTTSEMIGIALRSTNIIPYVVYTSPELRCVQTAAAIVSKLDSSFTMLRVEPALADWSMWADAEASQNWLTPRQLAYLGYPVDISYVPHLDVTKFPREETPADYMKRLCDFYVHARQTCSDQMVMIVANPAAGVLMREAYCDSVQHLRAAADDTPPCTVHTVRAGSGRILHNESDKSIMKFTRTVVRGAPKRASAH